MLKILKVWLASGYKLKLLAVLVFFLLTVMQLALAFIPFRCLTRWFLTPRCPPRDYPATEKASLYAHLIGRMIKRLAVCTPWPAKCLAQGLVCRILLRKLLIPSVVYLGVAKDEQQQFIAHCWVNFGQVTILGGSDSQTKFKIITQFEDR